MDFSRERERLNEMLLSNIDIRTKKKEILQIIPELIVCVNYNQNHPCHVYNVFDHILETTNKVNFDLILKLSALLHDVGKPYKVVVVDNVDRFWGHEETGAGISCLVLTRLGYSQEFVKKVYTIIKYHDHKTFATIEGVKDTANLVGNDLVPYLFQLQIADLLSHSEKYYKVLIPKLNAAVKIYEDNRDIFNKGNK
ncbi:HD domain-containing protein [Clostridium estertheticum]|uniref:HD domain-containing protein n=1 Tax=Clostridium estertheticum TaxID=238834 RepID=UPI001C0E548D|nr:HD domain-containing protein [Clostridium estertheticum]MBU3198517.1 HD domain-containing protein [Clostridium estertheticum]WAG64498.1 HD domain-containing protein [Clostridium estertheticum]